MNRYECIEVNRVPVTCGVYHQSSPRYCLYLPADSGRLRGQRFNTAPTTADGANLSQVCMNIHERGEWAGRRALVFLCIEPTPVTPLRFRLHDEPQQHVFYRRDLELEERSRDTLLNAS